MPRLRKAVNVVRNPFDMQSLEIKGRHRKVYSIEEGGIVIKTYDNPKLPDENHIAFENIRRDKFFYVTKPYAFLVFAGLALIIFVTALTESVREKNNLYIYNMTWAILSLASVVLFYTFRHKVYFLKTFKGNYIKFRVRKNEKQIDEFIKSVLQKRDEYLKFTYGTPNSYLSYDAQYSNFNIMLSEKVITAKEHAEKIEQLNTLFRQTVPVKTSFIGYSQN